MATTHGFASFFLFVSFVLETLTTIGQLSNRPFLRNLYFGLAVNRHQNVVLSFGLWNYCQGTMDSISHCGYPVAAFNWATTPQIAQLQAGLGVNPTARRLCLVLFIACFVSAILSLILWITTLATLDRVGLSLSRSLTGITCLNLLVTLTSLIVSLIMVIGGVKTINNVSWDWSGHAGTLVWVLVGATLSLFVALICYVFALREAGRQHVKDTAQDPEDPEAALNSHAEQKSTTTADHSSSTALREKPLPQIQAVTPPPSKSSALEYDRLGYNPQLLPESTVPSHHEKDTKDLPP